MKTLSGGCAVYVNDGDSKVAVLAVRPLRAWDQDIRIRVLKRTIFSDYSGLL